MRSVRVDENGINCAIRINVPGGHTINESVKNTISAIQEDGGTYFSLWPLVYVCQGNDIPDKIAFKDLKPYQDDRSINQKQIYVSNTQVIRFINDNKEKFHISDDIQDIRFGASMAKMVIADAVRKVVHRGTVGEPHTIFDESEDEVKKFAKESEKGFEMMFNNRYFLKDGSYYLESNLTFNGNYLAESIKKFLSEEGQAAMKKHSKILEKYPNFNKFCQILKQATF